MAKSNDAAEILQLATRSITDSKHLAVWDWLYSCPLFPTLYFVFSDAGNGDTVLVPESAIKDMRLKGYSDGSQKRIYDFFLIQYLPFTIMGNTTENINWLNVFEGLAAWVEQQEEAGKLPKFPAENIVERVEVLDGQSPISARDESGQKLQFAVRITYTDNTKKRLW